VTTVNGAIAGLVNTLAIELAPVRVNAVHPAAVGDSPHWQAQPELSAQLRASTPTGRLITTDDVAAAVEFLLENASINAVNLIVDGGLHLR
jgi:NAD(P)-dependent dehydrogenase (short-subunit alcohol dehydrogenase family)